MFTVGIGDRDSLTCVVLPVWFVKASETFRDSSTFLQSMGGQGLTERSRSLADTTKGGERIAGGFR